MWEVFYLLRDDWGKVSYIKRKGMIKKLQTAIRLANKLGSRSYVKKYGEHKLTYFVE